VVVTDTVQQQILQNYRPDVRTRVIGPMFPPSSSRQPCEARQGLLFVASNDTAATQLASHWLLLALVPQILARLPRELRPGFVVHVVGRVSLSPHAQEAAEQLQRVYVHDELEPAAMQLLYDSVKVVAAPFATSSFRAEVLQAMMLRVPVIATPTAVEGLRVEAGQDCEVAGSFQEFVKRAVAVYSDCEAWGRLSRQSYELVRARHSKEALQLEWLHMMRDAGVGPVPRDLRRDCHDGDGASR
jgi:O-antigen biosynthesis protein